MNLITAGLVASRLSQKQEVLASILNFLTVEVSTSYSHTFDDHLTSVHCEDWYFRLARNPGRRDRHVTCHDTRFINQIVRQNAIFVRAKIATDPIQSTQ